MPDNNSPEARPPQNHQERGPRKSNEELIREDISSKDAAQVKRDLHEKMQVVITRRMTEDLKKRINNAMRKDGYPPQSFAGDKDDLNDANGKARYTQKLVQEILTATVQDKTPMVDGIPTDAATFGLEAVKSISQNLPIELVTENSSPYLFDLFNKILTGEIKSVEGLQEAVIEMSPVSQFDTHIFNQVQLSLYQIAESHGVSREVINDRLRSIDRNNTRDQVEQMFKHDWDNRLQIFFGGDPNDYEILRAISSTDFFFDYVKKIKTEADNPEKFGLKGPHETDEQYARRKNIYISDRIRNNVGATLSKIFNSVDKEHKTEFFENAMQKGFPLTLDTIFYDIRRKLLALELSIQRESAHNKEYEELANMFYLPTSVSKYLQEFKGDPAQERMVGSQVVVPAAGNIEVNVRQYILGMMHFVDSEREARAYFHNIQVLFNQPKGEKGFYSQLASYAEKMTAIDLDAIQLLPDSEIIMAAVRLYRRYLEEEFTKYDWMHTTTMFTPDYYMNNSDVQKGVLNDLRKLVRGMNLDGLKTKDEVEANDWRILRAMTFAMGISKGVDMSEPELAAWADPILKDGQPTYYSFYTNDSGALEVLNPIFSMMRFQAEGMTLGPLAWATVKGAMDKNFDHVELFQRINEYRDSYKKGLKGLNKKSPNELRAFEAFVNMFKVGSPYTRGGWRFNSALEGWMVKDGNGALKGFESFRALEYIGTQVLIHYINTGNMDKTLSDSHAKTELFNHLFTKYIQPRTNAGTVNDYIDALIEKYVDMRYEKCPEAAKGKFNRKEEIAAAKKNQNKIFLNNALAHIIATRNPTKFLRVERDRTTLDGERGWATLKKQLYGNDTASVGKMDHMMKNIMIVEERLRSDTSMAMRRSLELQANDTEKSLHTFTPEAGRDYVVNKDSIERVLREMGLNDEIAETVRFYEKLMEFYKDKNYVLDFGQKLLDDAFPFAISNDDTDFTFIAHRAAGQRLLARALGDTASTENGSYAGLQEFMQALPAVAKDINKKDYHPIIHAMEKAKHTVEQVHGLERADMISQYLAQMAITFFKEDTKAEHWWSKAATIGTPTSLAAEFAGGSLRVWEWDTETIYSFIRDLETHKILPSAKYAHELSKPSDHPGHGNVEIQPTHNWRGKVIGHEVVRWKPYSVKKEPYVNIWGNVKEKKVRVKNELPEFSSQTLREYTHSKHSDVVKKIFHTYGPAFLAALAFYYLRQAIKEEEKGGH